MINPIKEAFVATVFGVPTKRLVTAYFTNGDSAEYTMGIFHMLIEEPDIERIEDFETGEILYEKEI